MEANAGLKDFWGNDAIDFGSKAEMTDKYADNIFVFVSDKPFGNGYVLFVCSEGEEELAHDWVKNYRVTMKNKGAYGVGVNWGYNIACAKTQGFLGGIRI